MSCQEGVTPLHTASGCGFEDIASLLLSRGADGTLRDKVCVLYACDRCNCDCDCDCDDDVIVTAARIHGIGRSKVCVCW